jgi:hypothetical protein
MNEQFCVIMVARVLISSEEFGILFAICRKHASSLGQLCCSIWHTNIITSFQLTLNFVKTSLGVSSFVLESVKQSVKTHGAFHFPKMPVAFFNI